MAVRRTTAAIVFLVLLSFSLGSFPFQSFAQGVETDKNRNDLLAAGEQAVREYLARNSSTAALASSDPTDEQYRQFLSDVLNDNYPDIWTDENHAAIVAYTVEQLGLAADFETPYAQWTTFIPVVANGTTPIVSTEAMVASEGVALQSTSRVRYDRNAAVRYAYEYANRYGGRNRNRAYPDFSNIGGDCTNFVSQAVLAGGISMRGDGTCRSESTTREWYMYRLRTECGWWGQSFRLWKWSTAWTTVRDFRVYMRDYVARRVEAYPANREAISLLISRARPGDIIQFDVYDTSIKGWVPTHSVIVVRSESKGGYYYNDLRYNDHSGSSWGNDTFEGSIRGKLNSWGGTNSYRRMVWIQMP